MAIDSLTKRESALVQGEVMLPDGYLTNMDRVSMLGQYPFGPTTFNVNLVETITSTEDFTKSLIKQLNENTIILSDNENHLSARLLAEIVQMTDWLAIEEDQGNEDWTEDSDPSTTWTEATPPTSGFGGE